MEIEFGDIVTSKSDRHTIELAIRDYKAYLDCMYVDYPMPSREAIKRYHLGRFRASLMPKEDDDIVDEIMKMIEEEKERNGGVIYV